MQMIDVLKRLAELDAKNPNIQKTDEAVKFGNYTSGVGTDRPADQAGRNALAKDLKFNRDFHRQHIKDPTNPYRKGAASGAVNDVTPVNDPRTTHPSQIEGQGSDNDLVGMVQSTIEDILSGAQQGQDMTDNIADELGDHFDAVQNSGDETLQQAYSMVRDAADTSPEEQAQAAQSALEMLSGGKDMDEGMWDKFTGSKFGQKTLDTVANALDTLAGNRGSGSKTGQTFGKGQVTPGGPMGPIARYQNRNKNEGVAEGPDLDDAESLNDFFSNLRNDVERGLNVVDTFHDKVDQLPDELPAEVVQFLRDQSAEADGAQDDPEEMKSIMLAAIDKVESELGLHNNMKRPMSESLDECGMMGSMSQPHTPASVNVTADNGMELTNMLKDIMSLAGLRKVGPDDLGHEREPSVMTGEPGVSVAKLDSNPMDMKSIISKIDSMNDEPADEEIGGALAGGALGGAAGLVAGGIPGAIGGALSGAAAGDSLTDPDADEVNKEAWNNTPRNPTKVPHMSKDAMTNKEVHNQDQSGHPGVGDRMDGDRPKAFADVTYESLMKEYQKFINEN